MSKSIRRKGLYAIYDINMAMFTDPVCFRNDDEAVRSFQKMKEQDLFHGVDVELYRIADYLFDPSDISDVIVVAHTPKRIFVQASVEDGSIDCVQPDGPGIGAEACSFDRHDF